MQWEDVRKIYPNQYVKLQILASRTVGNIKFVDDVALIRAIQDPEPRSCCNLKMAYLYPTPQMISCRL